MVLASVSQVWNGAKSKVSVRPLLRSPFVGRGRVNISAVRSGWTGDSATILRHNEIRTAILNARVGGMFWHTEQELPAKSKIIVVLPADHEDAQRLWRKFNEQHNGSAPLVVYPAYGMREALRWEILEAGADTAPAGDPYPFLDIATGVFSDSCCDLTALAALADIPAFQLGAAGFEKVLPYEISAWIDEGTAYTNPYTAAPAGLDEIVEILGDWRRVFTRNRAIGVCAGISLWKRKRIKQLLHTGLETPSFRRSTAAALRQATSRATAIGGWATRMPAMLGSKARAQNIPLVQLEDGFIRSLGLGCALTAPASIVMDRRGIYLDPAQPSDLEVLLSDTAFSESTKRRARRLIALLTAKAVSKYGFGGEAPVIKANPGQRVILVPGQVADDLSLQLGARGPVRNNSMLLQEVRQRHPDAFIVYRPHPDVVAGYRQGAIPDPVACGYADQLLAGGSIAPLLSLVDEVHTMTSLAGFEALLRGRIVETYGQPFYAGWGLTKDHVPVTRRQRRLSLEELVAGALILYPNYVDPLSGLLCGPETLIARLAQPELWHPNLLMRVKNLEGICRRLWVNRPLAWTRFDA